MNSPAPDAAVEIGPYRPGDETSICALFARCFARTKDVATWRWQFLGQGGEPHVMLARDARGEVLAFFGGVPRRALVDRRDSMFSSAVDSMVDPRVRQGLQRRGLFARVVDRWVSWFGDGGRIAVGFGLPNDAALRIGRRLLGYTPIEDTVLHVLDLPAPAAWRSDLQIVVADEPDPDHDRFWERVRPQSGVVFARDARYLTWRYANCPGRTHRLIRARRNGRLVGVAVYSPRYVVERWAALSELLFEEGDTDAVLACVAAAATLAQADEREHVAALFSRRSQQSAALARLGFAAVPTGLPLVARSFDARLPLDDIRERFLFSAGDFDLV